jgi:hypothetical protein
LLSQLHVHLLVEVDRGVHVYEHGGGVRYGLRKQSAACYRGLEALPVIHNFMCLSELDGVEEENLIKHNQRHLQHEHDQLQQRLLARVHTDAD